VSASLRPFSLGFFYLITVTAVLLDQFTKHWISREMSRGESRSVIGDFFRLTYVHNDGAAFGLDLGGRWAFIAVTVVVSLFIIISYSRTEKTPLARWALALILGGAIGNLIDRIRLGEVIDFLQFGIGRLYWPIFNVADIAVSIGVGLLALHLFRKEPEQDARSGGPNEDAPQMSDGTRSPHAPTLPSE
jgi:signal peptidase II